MPQDIAFELPQGLSGLQPELIGKTFSVVPQHIQRIDLTTGQIQGGGQHGGGRFPLGPGADVSLQRGHRRGVAAELHQCRGAVLHRGQPEFAQTSHFRYRPQGVAELRERVARPLGKRLIEELQSAMGIRFVVCGSDSGLHPPRVDGVHGQPQAVPGCGTDQDAGGCARWTARFDTAPQVRDVDLQRRERLGWRFAFPQVVDEPVDRDRMALCGNQPRQQGALQP